MDKHELIERINRRRRELGAVILAHNYVSGEVQDIADFVGDSLELSIKARDAQAPVIVFAGVSFMAETAKVLSPGSRVLHPDSSAGCPMADMATAEAVHEYRTEHPDTILVAYVNTTAAVKAEVDICCTSANATKIIRSLPADRRIMFLPDRNLGANVMAETGRKLELWPGYCPTHNQITPEMIVEARSVHPGAPVLIHPECPPEVVREADFALSTGGMLRVVRESSAQSFIIGTESGIVHRLRKENPDREFFTIAPEPLCPNMKKLTLVNIVEALEHPEREVTLPVDLIERARRPIVRMLEVSAAPSK